MENINNNHPLFFYSEIKVNWKNKDINRKIAFAGTYDNNVLKIGKSICSEKDVFNKNTARKIALGRANKKPIVTINLSQYDNKKISDIFVEKCKELLA